MSLFEEFLIVSCCAYKTVPTTQWAALRASWHCWQLAGPGPIGSCLQATAPPITFGCNVFVNCEWEEAQEICCGKKRDQSLWNWKKKREREVKIYGLHCPLSCCRIFSSEHEGNYGHGILLESFNPLNFACVIWVLCDCARTVSHIFQSLH